MCRVVPCLGLACANLMPFSPKGGFLQWKMPCGDRPSGAIALWGKGNNHTSGLLLVFRVPQTPRDVSDSLCISLNFVPLTIVGLQILYAEFSGSSDVDRGY